MQEDPDVAITVETVAKCLSLLCKTGDGLAHAYVRFDAHDRYVEKSQKYSFSSCHTTEDSTEQRKHQHKQHILNLYRQVLFYCVFCVFCVFIILSVHFLSSSCLLFVSSGFCIWASLPEIKRWNGME